MAAILLLSGEWSTVRSPPALSSTISPADPRDLQAEAGAWWPAGRIVQASNADEMVYGVEETPARISHTTTLRPGDLLATGPRRCRIRPYAHRGC